MSNLEVFPSEKYDMDRTPISSKTIKQSEKRTLYRYSGNHRRYYRYSIIMDAQDDAEVKEIYEFFVSHQFSESGTNEFLFDDFKDNFVSGSVLGSGTGSKTSFNMERTFTVGNRSATENITFIKTGTVDVFIDGSGTADYTLLQHSGIINFNTAPASGTEITADFGFYRRVVFSDNEIAEDSINGLHHTMEFELVEKAGGV